MEGSAISHSISGFSDRKNYQRDEFFRAVEELAEKYSHDYLHVFVNAVAHGSIEEILDFFKEGKGKNLVKFKAHAKPELRDRCFPELPYSLADRLCVQLLLDYNAETALDVLAMSAQKTLIRKDEKIRNVYRIYYDSKHTNKLPLLDRIFGVDYSKDIEDVLRQFFFLHPKGI